MFKKASTALVKTVKGGLDPNIVLNKSVEVITNAIKEYHIVREQEITKRRAIRVRKEVALEAIRSQKEVILTYIEKTFDERNIIFKEMFEKLDYAIANNDSSLVDKSLTVILSTLQTNPFKSFDDFKNKLQDKSFTLEL